MCFVTIRENYPLVVMIAQWTSYEQLMQNNKRSPSGIVHGERGILDCVSSLIERGKHKYTRISSP